MTGLMAAHPTVDRRGVEPGGNPSGVAPAYDTGVFPSDLQPEHSSGRAGESNPDSLVAGQGSFRLTSRPFVRRSPEVRPRIELGPPPYQGEESPGGDSNSHASGPRA